MAVVRPSVRAGDQLRVIAPAGPFDADAFRRGLERLRQRYRVSHAHDILERQGYLAGNDARRIRELHEALDDPEVSAIIAARGGYGATRLLEHVDAERVRARPRLLVGFSDITALHALWARAGVASLHGPMVATLGDVSAARFDRWVARLEGEPPPAQRGLRALSPGRAAGRLLGGNLSVLTALIGTGQLPDLEGSVLFLEDVSERPYRVDRMLTTWRAAGLLRGASAIVLGAFTSSEPGEDGVAVEEVLQERLGDLGIPVLAGLSAGHLEDNLELPFGLGVEVDASAGTLSFER